MKLTISDLSKTYPNGVQALKNVSLEIPTGMFGLLGPNGAGKSTLMRTIATLQDADTGSIQLDDVNVLEEKDDIRRLLGYLPQEFGVYPKVSAEDMLNHIAALKGLSNSKERKEVVQGLLAETNLYADRKKKLGGFSGGMKQRFGIAQALIGNPKLIIVDEPTAGLDPMERYRFLNLLSKIGENVIVILSTHIVEDVNDLCTNMAIISQGDVILQGEPLQLVESLQGKIWQTTVEEDEISALNEEFMIISTKFFAGKTIIHVYADAQPDSAFKPVTAGLKDLYFTHLNGAENGAN
ncbi:ABC transporter ATP-binding protein [Caldithrix abyssi]|nr:ABC transporter ATP-binding protein [Caldithrix abyssi]